jgi:hypothetical protein
MVSTADHGNPVKPVKLSGMVSMGKKKPVWILIIYLDEWTSYRDTGSIPCSRNENKSFPAIIT